MRMLRVIISFSMLCILLLSACGNDDQIEVIEEENIDDSVSESIYSNEDEKLETYAINTAKAVRAALFDTNIIKGCFTNEQTGECEYLPIKPEEFLKIAPWLDLYENDIVINDLSEDNKDFYAESLFAIREHKDLLESAKGEMSTSFDEVYENNDEKAPEERFLRIVGDHFPESIMDSNFIPIDEVVDSNYELLDIPKPLKQVDSTDKENPAGSINNYTGDNERNIVLEDIILENWKEESSDYLDITLDGENKTFSILYTDEGLINEVFDYLIGDKSHLKDSWEGLIESHRETSEFLYENGGEGYTFEVLNPKNTERSLVIIVDGEYTYRVDD